LARGREEKGGGGGGGGGRGGGRGRLSPGKGAGQGAAAVLGHGLLPQSARRDDDCARSSLALDGYLLEYVDLYSSPGGGWAVLAVGSLFSFFFFFFFSTACSLPTRAPNHLLDLTRRAFDRMGSAYLSGNTPGGIRRIGTPPLKRSRQRARIQLAHMNTIPGGTTKNKKKTITRQPAESAAGSLITDDEARSGFLQEMSEYFVGLPTNAS